MRCSVCGGEGGFWDTLDGRPPIGVWEEPPDFYWIECPHCLGTGREPPPKVRKERKPKGVLGVKLAAVRRGEVVRVVGRDQPQEERK